MQIGTNNCTARYRTLSGGGIGESPSLSPSPSSDYDDDEVASGKQQQQQQHLPTLNCSSKNKWNGNHKGAIISQKATVHHVSTLTQKSFGSAQNTNNFFDSGLFSRRVLFIRLHCCCSYGMRRSMESGSNEKSPVTKLPISIWSFVPHVFATDKPHAKQS